MAAPEVVRLLSVSALGRCANNPTVFGRGCLHNWAHEILSRMRCAEIGHHHHISTWREDNRRTANGAQVSRLAGLAM